MTTFFKSHEVHKMHKLLIGLYCLFSSLDELYERLVPGQERGPERQNPEHFAIFKDDAAFHLSLPVKEWFTAHPRMVLHFCPPFSPLLNAIKEFFSSLKWKFHDHQKDDQMSLLVTLSA